MQDLAALAFLATCATLSVAAFAGLQRLVVPRSNEPMKIELSSRPTN